MKPRIIRKVGLALFQDHKIMMVRDNVNDEVFYFVGGTVEVGESDLECLKREVQEELAVEVDESTLKFLGEFEAPAHGKPGVIVNIRLFQGEVRGEPKPSSEIVELQWFDTSVGSKHLSIISRDHVFPWLKQHGYIN